MALCYRTMLVFYQREITIIGSPLLLAVYFNSRPAPSARATYKLIWNECFRDEFQLTSAKPRTT